LARASLHRERWVSLLGNSEAGNVYPVAADGDTWRVRMFAPGLGVGEDPATGAAAAALAGWLIRRTPAGAATRQWTIRQGAEIGRPSTIYLEADVEAGRATRVRVGGAAVMIGDGVLRL
jgi:trans-2,3-dihydro-3-hydroxyanthranilate isomerase